MIKNKKIAIDIVLLLPPDIEEFCVELNKESDKTKYVSFENGNKPHISLMIGCINKNDLEKIENELKNEISNIGILDVSIIELETVKFRDYFINNFSLFLTEKIKKLNKICMDIMKKYNGSKITIDMFDEKEKVDELTVDWVNKYHETCSGLNYRPHITLGVNCSKNIPVLPINFKVEKVAIFQLGSYVTCKEKLAEFTLN